MLDNAEIMNNQTRVSEQANKKSKEKTTARLIADVSPELKEQFNAKKKELNLKCNDELIRYLLNEQSLSKSTSKKKLSAEQPDTKTTLEIINLDVLNQDNDEVLEKKNIFTYTMSLLMLLDTVEKDSTEYSDICKVLNFVFESIDNIYENLLTLKVSNYNDVNYVYGKIKEVQSPNSTQSANSGVISEDIKAMQSIKDYLNNIIKYYQNPQAAQFSKSTFQEHIDYCTQGVKFLETKITQAKSNKEQPHLIKRYINKYNQINADYYNKIIENIEKEQKEIESKKSKYIDKLNRYKQ